MKVVEKIKLIEDIACDLQQKYTFSDIEIFLAEFDINYGYFAGKYNSKRTFVKEVLKKDVSDKKRLEEERIQEMSSPTTNELMR